MKPILKHYVLIGISAVALIACKKDTIKADYTSQIEKNTDQAVASLQNLDVSTGTLAIIELPSSVDQAIRNEFKWYTHVKAPNGKPIHILAQNEWTIEQVVYTKSVMEHYLTSINGIKYGQKDRVANAIANNNGAMTMYNTKAGSDRSITGQDLQATETVSIGTPDFLNLSVRNAALEEILHFVQDYGLVEAYPSFQEELNVATSNALNNQLFIPWSALPVADYDNELLAAFNDSYWGAIDNSVTDNPYLYNSREACEKGDPLTTRLMKDFLPEYFAAKLHISATFVGTFYMSKNVDYPYTNQSQYFKDMQLLGDNDSNLYGNKFGNELTGNNANNELMGGIGDDVLDGLNGFDKALFTGKYTEYKIEKIDGKTTVTDLVNDRNGVDELKNMEEMVFSDQTIQL